MRKWMLNLHLYGGLVCAPYLLIFGFSSLLFNHHFAFVTPKTQPVNWEAPLSVEPLTNNDAMAESVRNSLGLMGWTIPRQTPREAGADIEFDLERPGKSYTIHTELKQHRARVEERRNGFWQAVNSLHALGAVPNSRFTLLWGGYTELCTGFMVFAAISGLYLWINSKREQRVGTIMLCAAVVLSFALMLVVVRWG